jgi:DNA-binding beta-propeller fold protein YncE
MKRLLVLAVPLLACGGKAVPPSPPAVTTVALPSGSALKPYDPAAPGLAKPSGMALFDGVAYVALNNQDAKFAVRGPGLLAAYTVATGTVTLVDLGGADERQCQDPVFVRATASHVYATCSGDFNDNGAGSAIVEIDPATHSVTRSVATPAGSFGSLVSPSGLAEGPTRFWFGDAASGQVFAVDKAAFTVAGPFPISCPTTGTFVSTGDVLVAGGDLYALCSNDTGGILTRLDATTGAEKMHTDIGPTAVEIADMGGGRLAVVSGADNGLRIVTATATALTVQAFFPFASKTATLQDVRASGKFLYTAASGSNTVQKIDPDASGGPKVIAEAPLGTNASPWNILPLDDNDALVSNLGTSNLAKVTWAP